MTAHVGESAENGTNAQLTCKRTRLSGGFRLPPATSCPEGAGASLDFTTTSATRQNTDHLLMIFVEGAKMFQDSYFHLQQVYLVGTRVHDLSDLSLYI